MSKVQEAGLLEALGEAEGLARVIRAMSDGRLDLRPAAVLVKGTMRTRPLELSWEQAKTEARSIAGTMGKQVLTRVQETFCSVCGPLDEPGVHPQHDCPRWQEIHGSATSADYVAAIERRAAARRPEPEEA